MKVWNGPEDGMRGRREGEEKQRGHKRSITMKNGVISRCLLAAAAAAPTQSLSSLFGNGTFPFLSPPYRMGFSGIIGPRQEGIWHCIWQGRCGPCFTRTITLTLMSS